LETEVSKRIDEELVCIESLAHFLKENKACRELHIQREVDDPPDFWITICGENFGAEVTSIVADYGYNALCMKLEDAIEKDCKANNCLNGNYVLTLMGYPKIPKRTSGQWEELIAEARSYITATMNNSRANKRHLLQDPNGYLAIEKLSDHGATVGLAGPVDTKWEGEARSELTRLFQTALEKKRKVLERKGVLTFCQNIILLFYDAYGFCDMEDAIEAFQQVRGFDWFHSVYWAASFTDRPNERYPGTPGRRGCFLYSRKAEWKS
jgi:hypothetical protein